MVTCVIMCNIYIYIFPILHISIYGLLENPVSWKFPSGLQCAAPELLELLLDVYEFCSVRGPDTGRCNRSLKSWVWGFTNKYQFLMVDVRLFLCRGSLPPVP
jgi:hypothetical protein